METDIVRVFLPISVPLEGDVNFFLKSGDHRNGRGLIPDRAGRKRNNFLVHSHPCTVWIYLPFPLSGIINNL